MSRFTKHQITRFYRIMVIFLGFLFIFISGCRSRSVDDGGGSQTTDTLNTDDEWMLAPEYGGPPADWEEVPIEEPIEEVKTPKETPKESPPKQEVKQPDPGPLDPAAAYGTNINFDSPTVIQPNN
jgi:hypothetical protein